jgi:HPt (histidine-containing phosphotransfer) domain-containing protein
MAGSGKRLAAFESGTWRQLCSLADDTDMQFLEGLFETYLESARAQLDTLRRDADTDTKRRAAHTLLGSSLSIGVMPVATICRKLELELGKVPIPDMLERVAKIEAHLRAVAERYPAALAEMMVRESS